MSLMSSDEAIQRMQTKSSDDYHPLYYHKDGKERERYYIRFDVLPEMLKDIDLSRGIFQCVERKIHILELNSIYI